MNIQTETLLKKSSGKVENYSPDKLKRSLTLSGMKPIETDEITKKIEASLNTENLSTQDIFDETKSIVFKKSHIAGMKYSLKYAIGMLGPSGFVFEKFIARALHAQGFEAELDLILDGKCVKHEVDIRAISVVGRM
jgi:hypothetical protein